MFEIALAALALTTAQDAEVDPWVEVDGEWQRSFTCTVDDTGHLRMDDRDRDPSHRMNEGDVFQLTVRDDENYEDTQLIGITITPPDGTDAPPSSVENCILEEDGTLFRCTASLRAGQVIDWYGSLEEHRFNVIWINNVVGMAASWGSDPSNMRLNAASGICLD